jgi:hypothetical protein
MLMRLVQAFRRREGTHAPRPLVRPRGAAPVDAPANLSRRHLARAAGGEWRATCGVATRAPSSLDGGLDRTAVLVWRDGSRAIQPMGR